MIKPLQKRMDITQCMAGLTTRNQKHIPISPQVRYAKQNQRL